MTPTPANDNQQRHAADFGDLAARRAWLAKLPDKAKPVLAWPTAERLSRIDTPALASALMQYAELDRPAQFVAVNDNDSDSTAIDADQRSEVRPGVMELLRAAASDGCRCSVISCKVNGTWRITTRQRGIDLVSTGQLGALVFHGGEMVSWGITERGKALRPLERQRAPKGSRTAARSAASVRALVHSDAPIAKGAVFLGGITRPRGNASRPDLGEAEAVIEFDRNTRRNAVRLALGPETCRVLDLAISDSSAREIGELFGHAGKTAERKAARMINAALQKFQEIAAA